MPSLPMYHPIRIVRRNRRTIAALLAAAAVLAAVQAARPPGTDTVAVVVAAGPIAAGSVINGSDLEVAHVAAALAPASAARSPAGFEGSVAAVSIEAGEPISAARLLSRVLAEDPGHPGNLPMPLRLSDSAAASLLHPGNHINVIAATPAGAELAGSGASARMVAGDVLVLSLIEEDTGIAGSGGASSGGRLALVSVAADQAEALAAAETGSHLTFTVQR
jgi:pilus assembly protein CpaB